MTTLDGSENLEAMTATAPNYPVEACNENGPYPQDVAIRFASYGDSAVTPTLCDITIDGMTLSVALKGQQPNTLHVVTPGDNAGEYPQITTGSAGGGTTTYDYDTPGTYTVTVARDDGGTQTVIATNTVQAVAVTGRRR